MAVQAGLCWTSLKTPKTVFLMKLALKHHACEKISVYRPLFKHSESVIIIIELLCKKPNDLGFEASAQSKQSWLYTYWVVKDLSFLHVNSKDSDQTGPTPWLI